MRDRELDATHRGVTARHILTDGHATAVLRTCWIAGDLTGYDHTLCTGNELSFLKVISTINNFPECRQFCCAIDSLPTNSCASAACVGPSDAGTSNSRRLRKSAARRISQIFLDEIHQHISTNAGRESSESGCSCCQREAPGRIAPRSCLAKCSLMPPHAWPCWLQFGVNWPSPESDLDRMARDR